MKMAILIWIFNLCRKEHSNQLFIGASHILSNIDDQEKAAILENSFGDYFVDMIGDLISNKVPTKSIEIDEKGIENLSSIVIETIAFC